MYIHGTIRIRRRRRMRGPGLAADHAAHVYSILTDTALMNQPGSCDRRRLATLGSDGLPPSHQRRGVRFGVEGVAEAVAYEVQREQT